MDSSKIDDFWGALKPIVFVAQLFTFFPVQGVFARDPQQIRFQWIHLRTAYSMAFLVLGGLIIVAQINHTVLNQVDTSMISKYFGNVRLNVEQDVFKSVIRLPKLQSFTTY